VAHRFLAKPCSASALREAIERACNLQDGLSSADIRRVVSGIAKLPSPKSAVDAVIAAVTDPGPTVDRNHANRWTGHGDVSQGAAICEPRLFRSSPECYPSGGQRELAGNRYLAESYPACKTLSIIRSASCSLGWFPGHAGTAFDPYRSRRRTTAAREGISRHCCRGRCLLHELGDLIAGAYMPEAYRSSLHGAGGLGSRTFEVEEERLGFSWRKTLRFNALAAGA
jgi:hypothetical protein